jgi:mannose-1-phosphate guanylyltransferase
MVSLHADHAIQPPDAFLQTILDGARLASETHRLFTVSVPPTRPETGFGYIHPGDPVRAQGGEEGFLVRSFVEKPNRDTAAEYLREGYLWNSGIFIWRAAAFLEEVAEVAPELARLTHLLEEDNVEAFFREAPAISVDEAVLERSARVASVRATFQWDDLGSWESLSRTRPADPEGNVSVGSAHIQDSRGNIVYSETGSVVLFGVEGLVVVRSGDTVMVVGRNRAPELRDLVEALPEPLRNPEEQ